MQGCVWMYIQMRILQIAVPDPAIERKEGNVSKKQYDVMMPFRLSKAQKEKLGRIAKRSHVSESEVLRRWIDGKVLIDYESFRAIRDLTFEIHKIGVNINQIAKNHNSGFYLPQDKKHLQEQVKELQCQLEKIQEAVLSGKGNDGNHKAAPHEGV